MAIWNGLLLFAVEKRFKYCIRAEKRKKQKDKNSSFFIEVHVYELCF